MGSRFGLDYLLPDYLVKTMKNKSPILLTPPASYTKKFITQQAAHSLTNPIYLFYMNPNIKMVTMQSPDLAKANCAILIDKEGRCYPMIITNKDQLKFAMLHFSKGEPYNPTIQ